QEQTKNEELYMLVAQFSKNEITYENFIKSMKELQ
ncbi:sialate O-acetylesterase, partial [Staphylococcus shinii]